MCFLLLLYDCLVRLVRFNSFSDNKREITHQQFQFSSVFVQCLSLRNTIAICVCVRERRVARGIFTPRIYRSEIALNLNRIEFAIVAPTTTTTENESDVSIVLQFGNILWREFNGKPPRTSCNQRSIGLA